jgi:hypothetical protein
MSSPPVTDHALVRYLERAKGFDMEAVRKHIAELCANGVRVGANCIRAEGVKFEIENGRVITCTPGGGFSNTKRQKFAQRCNRHLDRMPAHVGEGEV